MGNLRDKNDRAVRAYLAPIVAAVSAAIPIYISNDPNTRKVVDDSSNITGLLDIKTIQGPESPAGSGNYTFTTMVRAKMPGANQPDQPENENRVALGELINAVHDALHDSANHQDYHATAKSITDAGNALTGAENADMAAYSCINIVHNSAGGDKSQAEGDDLNFIEVITFQSFITGYNGYWN
jgi:hypothetical protein